MAYRRDRLQVSAWAIPMLYAAAAITAGLTFPRIETHLWPGLAAGMSVSAAMSIYSSIASGMIALTGIVFSLIFVMVTFSATAYSPRLALWVARDPVVSHALGIFTATFLYAFAALAWVDRSGSGKVPIISAWLLVALLLASVAMLVALIQRIGLLQIGRMLIFTGDRGRKVITTTYPLAESVVPAGRPDEFRKRSQIQIVIHHGPPRSVQTINVDALVKLAETSDGVIEMTAAVGDTVLELMPLLHVFGAGQTIDESKLRDAIELGDERTFEQDPKYAIRLLVDIAIRALSPAVNDPTTAVQALDQIGDLLLRLGRRRLEIGEFRDGGGRVRLVIPFPAWEDFVRLALDEILFCGANSIQVMRRMNALVSDLIPVVPEERRSVLKYWQGRLKASIARSFADEQDKLDASVADRQGLGIPLGAFRVNS
jgi:uncharacterized membrane protein